MVRILLVDKQELFRQSFKSLIESNHEIEVVLGTSTFLEANLKLHPGMADLVIADIYNLQNNDWTEFEKLIHHHPAMKLMIVSDVIDKKYLARLMEFKVRGYYSKLTNQETIINAIQSIQSDPYSYDLKLGPIVRNKLTSKHIDRSNGCNDEVVEFSERELQILDFIKKEWPSKKIAEELGLSIRTIETHRRRMIERTNSKSMLGVIVYVNENHILI